MENIGNQINKLRGTKLHQIVTHPDFWSRPPNPEALNDLLQQIDPSADQNTPGHQVAVWALRRIPLMDDQKRQAASVLIQVLEDKQSSAGDRLRRRTVKATRRTASWVGTIGNGLC